MGQLYLFWSSQRRLNWTQVQSWPFLVWLFLLGLVVPGPCYHFLPFFQAGIVSAGKRARCGPSTSLSSGVPYTHSYKISFFFSHPLTASKWGDCVWDGQRPLKLDVGAGAQPSHSRTMSISQSTQVAQGVCVQVRSSLGEGGWCGTNPWGNNSSTKQWWESRGWLGAWKSPWRPQLLTSSDKQTTWGLALCGLWTKDVFYVFKRLETELERWLSG